MQGKLKYAYFWVSPQRILPKSEEGNALRETPSTVQPLWRHLLPLIVQEPVAGSTKEATRLRDFGLWIGITTNGGLFYWEKYHVATLHRDEPKLSDQIKDKCSKKSYLGIRRIFIRVGEATLKKEFSHNYGYFQFRNLGTLVTQVSYNKYLSEELT